MATHVVVEVGDGLRIDEDLGVLVGCHLRGRVWTARAKHHVVARYGEDVVFVEVVKIVERAAAGQRDLVGIEEQDPLGFARLDQRRCDRLPRGAWSVIEVLSEDPDVSGLLGLCQN